MGEKLRHAQTYAQDPSKNKGAVRQHHQLVHHATLKIIQKLKSTFGDAVNLVCMQSKYLDFSIIQNTTSGLILLYHAIGTTSLLRKGAWNSMNATFIPADLC